MDQNGLIEIPTYLMVIHYWKLVCRVDVYDRLHGYYYLLRARAQVVALYVP
jgi:hypothetical protein